MTAVMTQDGQLFLLLAQGNGIIVELRQLLLQLQIPLLQAKHLLHLQDTVAYRHHQEQADEQQHAPRDHGVKLDGRQEEKRGIQCHVPGVAVVVA